MPVLSVFTIIFKLLPLVVIPFSVSLTYIFCRVLYLIEVANHTSLDVLHTPESQLLVFSTHLLQATTCVLAVFTIGLHIVPVVLRRKWKRILESTDDQFVALEALDKLTALEVSRSNLDRAEDYSKRLIHMAERIHAG
jgi:predicted membrane protein